MNYNKKVFVLVLALWSSSCMQAMDKGDSSSQDFDVLSYISGNPFAESYRADLVEKNKFLLGLSPEERKGKYAQCVVRNRPTSTGTVIEQYVAKDTVKLQVFDEHYVSPVWFKRAVVSGLVCGASLSGLLLNKDDRSSTLHKGLVGVAVSAGAISCGCLAKDALSYYQARKSIANIDREKSRRLLLTDYFDYSAVKYYSISSVRKDAESHEEGDKL